MASAGAMASGDAGIAHGSLRALALGALGVVYGDIGTSPGATPMVAIGMLSLIVWTLLITTSFKYVAVVMRADNELSFDMMDTSFFVGRVTIVARARSRLAAIRWRLFEAMHRNALAAAEFFRIPSNRVVELGGQVEL